jgi:hypothetical protein
MPAWRQETPGDGDLIVEVTARIRQSESSAATTCCQNSNLAAFAMTTQISDVSAARMPGKSCRTTKPYISAGLTSGCGERLVERRTIDMNAETIGREDVIPNCRSRRSPGRDEFRRITTKALADEMLQAEQSQHRTQLGRCGFGDTRLAKAGPLKKQDAIARTSGEQRKHAAGGTCACNRYVVA